MMGQIRGENPNLSQIEIGKKVSEKWESLLDADRKVHMYIVHTVHCSLLPIAEASVWLLNGPAMKEMRCLFLEASHREWLVCN